MLNATTRTVFDVITDFLATEPSPQEIIDFYMPDDLQARLDELLDKNGEGEITFSEREELQEFLNADQMFSMLKTKMKLKLKRSADESE
ncbi:MAG: hypothetical protein D6711_15640 [Chloroflexi bacterium]|nr:MAG: hypothetical protein D6711_15640 [Chloroflexota bacterium]